MSLPVPAPRPGRRYLRAPAPLEFPVQAKVPESGRHKELLLVLWQSVKAELGEGALVASDMFLYWDPTNPRRYLAPDLAVRAGTPAQTLDCWKTWEKGAPHLGVEIVSKWDRRETRLEETLHRYSQAGILEVVRFDPENRATPVRFWDLFDGDLVERDLRDPEAYRC
ncbi:MAG TPA: Uma2 family endonuclease, partial [Polyangiaceae bacterium]